MKKKECISFWTPESNRLGSSHEVAVYLGCTVEHVRNLVWRKELVATKASRLKFRGIDVQNFIDEREKR